LARRLAPERPVYGFQSQGLYGRALPHTNVEEMAAHYIIEMRSVQPRGPYLLGGWCFGGLVAFEMAQQLHSMAERVDMLAILNAPSGPEYDVLNTNPVLPPLAVRLREAWCKFSSLPGGEKVQFAVDKLTGHLAWRKRRLRHQAKVLASRLTKGVRHRIYRYYRDHRRPLPDVLRNSYFKNINLVAERRYQHQSYPGSMVIFRDQGPYPDPCLGWGRFVQGEIELFEIPVNVNRHRALMQEPAARMLAEKMEEYLSRKLSGSSVGAGETSAQARSSGQEIEANIVQ
jgi:thioesterase domain-containing protein